MSNDRGKVHRKAEEQRIISHEEGKDKKLGISCESHIGELRKFNKK